MNKNQRKNRPRKKEMPEKTWVQQLELIKEKYQHSGKPLEYRGEEYGQEM